MNNTKALNLKPIHEDDANHFANIKGMKEYIHTALQFEKERQSVILQSIGDGVIATDLDGNVILMNAVAENLTGWKSKEAENKPIKKVFHIINKITREDGHNPVESVLETGKTLKLDPNTVLISLDKNKVYAINDSCAPILDQHGTIMGVVLVFRDVTRQKDEETLKEKITADLVQRNKDHEQFSNIISHDLRGPVSNIISLTALLNDEDLEAEERASMMNALLTSAKRLDEVIIDLNVILSLGKHLNEKKEHIQLSTLVSDIQDSIKNVLEKEKVQFTLDFSRLDVLFTIKSYMYSIFYNLISNSIKYKRQDVPLEISIEGDFVDNKFMLTFKDNGLGIDLSKNGNDIFGLYARFHVDKAEGKGMGLHMVKVQVENLGGTIKVASTVNQGTTFTITF